MTGKLVSFAQRPPVERVAEEVAVGRPLMAERRAEPPQPAAGDLSGRPKLLMAIGAGNVGKTTLLRFIGETAMQRGGDLSLAAVDPENRSLADYFETVEMPPSYEPGAVARWLELFFNEVMSSRATVAIDFGGGDTSLGRVIADTPDLLSILADAGVTPVVLYVVGPRIDDLSPLATLERAGFQPEATAIVLNEGLADPTMERERAFGAVLGHSVMQAVLARGAVQLWMPRLLPANEIEVRRIPFAHARDGKAPEGREVVPLGPFDRARVRHWLEAMARELQPIASWIP